MTAAKTIAFLCHPYHRGGVTRWMADAAVAFSHRGYKVYFVTVSPSAPFISARSAESMVQLLQKTAHNVTVVTAPAGDEFELGTPQYRTYVYCSLLAKHVPAGAPIILSNDAAIWDTASALRASYPFIGVLHSDEQQYYDLARRHYPSIAVFTCVSLRVHRKTMEQSPQIPGNLIFTIPCGIELPPPRKDAASNNGILKMVYVGRVINYQKRVGDLLKVAASLAKQNVPYHLTIIGDGGDKPALQDAVTTGGLAGNVTFTGWQTKDQVQQHLYRSDVLLLTSDFEGTPISMMEALASGCGFSGTRVSGIEDYEHHAEAPSCFRIFDTGDMESAIKCLKELAAAPAPERAAAARRLAESEFSMDICLDRYEAAIASIPQVSYSPARATIASSDIIKSRLIAIGRSLKYALKKK